LGLLAVSFFSSPAAAISYTPFGGGGEGGWINGQTFTIAPGGRVYEVDAFVNLAGYDLNGGAVGTAAQLSIDSLPAGLSLSFSSTLSSDSTDLTLSYSLTNQTGSALLGLTFLSFLDADIDAAINTTFNEFASVSGTAPAGESYEVDAPFGAGNIFSHLLSASLDGTNAFPSGSQGDVSMALSFDVAQLADGATSIFEILVSEDGSALGGIVLTQSDPNSAAPTVVTYSGTVIPEPGTAAMLALGLTLFGSLRRARSRSRRL